MGAGKEPDLLNFLLKCFKLMIAWPRPRIWPIFFVPSFVVFSAEMGYVFSEDYNFDSAFKWGREYISGFINTVIIWLLYRSIEKAYNVRKFIKKDMERSQVQESPKAKQIMKRSIKFTKKIINCFVWMYILLFCAVVTPPLLSHFSDFKDERTFVFDVGPHEFWLRSDFAHLMLSAMFGVHIYVNFVGLLTFDTLYFISCHYIKSKSMVLSSALEDIGTGIKQIAKTSPVSVESFLSGTDVSTERLDPATQRDIQSWSGSDSDEAVIYAAITRCVKEHQKICRLRDVLEDCCSPLMFAVIATLVLSITLPIIEVLYVNMDDRGKMFVSAVTPLWAYLQLIGFCAWGQQISTKSQEVAVAAFSVYNVGLCSKRIGVALEMIMMRAQKPLFLSAANFFAINNQTSVSVLTLLLLALIPWPGPTVFKINCPRDSAKIVWKLVQKKWLPVLEKRHVTLGLECPLHPSRDIFGFQQAAKQQHRQSQWTCGFCGKSFYHERHLDAHFENRHRDTINMAEDAVCLADYCDIMRCEVLAAQEKSPNVDGQVNTDVELWRESTAYRTALTLTGPRDLARVDKAAVGGSLSAGRQQQQQKKGKSKETKQRKCAQTGRANGAKTSSNGKGQSQSQEGNPEHNATADPCGGGGTSGANLVDSSLPHNKQRHAELNNRLKSQCKPEELQLLKIRCETIVRDCIAGLLVNLSVQEFNEIEEELNRAACWYLTCDRYWEDSPAKAKHFPWTLVAVLTIAVLIGVSVCYYIIWIVFESDEVPSAHSRQPGMMRGPSAFHPPNPGVGMGTGGPFNNLPPYSEEYYAPSGDAPDGPDHYIYVTYPPDLKRRLLDSRPQSYYGQQTHKPY